MIQFGKRIIARYLLRVGFSALVPAQQEQTKKLWPGVVPLPWQGPDGETVCVVLDNRGRMVEPPQMCRTPHDMMALMHRHRRIHLEVDPPQSRAS